MSDTNETFELELTQTDTLQPIQSQSLVTTTSTDLIRFAIHNNASMDMLERLMAMKERDEENEARKAFHDAKAAFKQENIHVSKDKENKQFKSMYTTIGNLVGTVSPFLGKHGLSASWDTKQPEDGRIIVTCTLTHRLGYSESTELIVPPDTSGAKNLIQQIKSAITYAKVVTFEDVCGIASSDANEDDDGNGTGSVAYVSEKQLASLIDKVNAATTDAGVMAIWAVGRDTLGEAKNVKGVDELRGIVENRRKALKATQPKDAKE